MTIEQIRYLVANRLRGTPAAYRIARLLYRRWVLPSSGTRAEAVFRAKLLTNAWGGGESRSGRGSEAEQTRVLVAALPQVFRELGVGSLLDIPCGDFHWMREVDLAGIQYVGADIVPEVVEGNQGFARDGVRFLRLDLLHSRLPRADLVLVRDCLVHLPYGDIFQALRNLCRSGSTYVLTTTFPNRKTNSDIRLGAWRPLNLELAPFAFPPPRHLINEHCPEDAGRYADKSLGLWRLSDIKPIARWA
ncbi:MAG: class I SAM-dependent methyltransferase [Candidatus Rokuibacteriota bacterium]